MKHNFGICWCPLYVFGLLFFAATLTEEVLWGFSKPKDFT